MPRPLVFNLFCMDTPGHITHGTWRHPDSRAHEHNDLAYWIDLARLAERGKFDAIFFADVAGIYPKWRGSWDLIMRQAIQFPIGDPMALVSALAAATEHLGFVVTSSVLQHPPFTFARTAGTLDHLTQGRFGWNVVTSFTESASTNVGLTAITQHDARYRWAEEYCTVAYKLWEDSWDDDALVVDKERGVYVDAAKVREINHVGERYSVPGPHLVPPSPQRTPMLFQAGTSSAGRDFAARNAEGIFLISSSPEAAGEVVKDISVRAVAAGRRAEDLHFIQGLTFVVGSTEDEARRAEAELEQYIDGEAQVANFAGTTGLDLSSIDPAQPLSEVVEKVPGIRGAVQRMIDTAAPGSVPTVEDLARHTGKYWRVTGTPEQIADRLELWAAAGVTGINIMSMINPGTYVDFIDQVAPELQRRGLMQREYSPGTLREKMYPGRGPLLPDTHPARAGRGATPRAGAQG
jgi:long-chain alkane monooxygenase